MKVFVFGNPDLKADSLPLRILPDLRREFPEIDFRVLDPSEEWELPEDLIVLDAVQGIDEVEIFAGLEKFEATPRMTMHDFDALSNLRYLNKLGKLQKIKIIGIPPKMLDKTALYSVRQLILKSMNKLAF